MGQGGGEGVTTTHKKCIINNYVLPFKTPDSGIFKSVLTKIHKSVINQHKEDCCSIYLIFTNCHKPKNNKTKSCPSIRKYSNTVSHIYYIYISLTSRITPAISQCTEFHLLIEKSDGYSSAEDLFKVLLFIFCKCNSVKSSNELNKTMHSRSSRC